MLEHQEEQWEQIEMAMDSGSAVSACPENVGEVFGCAAPASGFKFVTADGRASVQEKGESGHRGGHATEYGHACGLRAQGIGVGRGRHSQKVA